MTFQHIYMPFHLVSNTVCAFIHLHPEPNPHYSRYYASGAEILDYFQKTVAKYNLDRDLKLEHELVSAEWIEETSKWAIQVKNANGIFADECDVLISARGFLSKWCYPDIEGLHSFKGELMHSANWNHRYDFRGKRIALIGNGSSAIQVLPELAPLGTHVTNYVRSKTWITGPHGGNFLHGETNHVYTEAEKKKFQDKAYLHEYRKEIQRTNNRAFARFFKGSKAQQDCLEETKELMLLRLNNNKQLASLLIPEWEVGCRRETPGPGYLECFNRRNVSLKRCGIQSITSKGIYSHIFELRNNYSRNPCR